MKILMVCLGNICRSPLATGILRDQFKKLGINGTVDSAGFEPYHIGDNPDERAQDIAKKHGIDISQHTARLFRKEDFDQYDKIYVMDDSNYHDVMYMARNAEDKKKVDYIMNVITPGNNDEVPDPYYGGLYKFEEVYTLLEKACKKIAEDIKK
jgi:protein-tyrosine phosphatase